MTLHSERCLIGRYPIWFTDVFSKSYFYFINHLWNSSCGSDFMCSKKVRNISIFDWDRQSRMRDYHLSLHALGKVKTNRPRASQICIGVIIVLPIKTQLLCDILIGRELNEITPTANGGLDILWQTQEHRISGNLLILCGGSQIWTPAVFFRCF